MAGEGVWVWRGGHWTLAMVTRREQHIHLQCYLKFTKEVSLDLGLCAKALQTGEKQTGKSVNGVHAYAIF